MYRPAQQAHCSGCFKPILIVCVDNIFTAVRFPSEVMQKLKEQGAIEGWREESYPITTAFDQPPLAVVERAAAVYMGIKSYGVHLNG